jgi:hypothetical protein
MNVILKKATTEDVSLLAEFNQKLIIEEKYDKSFTIDDLVIRMTSFINNEYSAYFICFENAKNIVGYLLINKKKGAVVDKER